MSAFANCLIFTLERQPNSPFAGTKWKPALGEIVKIWDFLYKKNNVGHFNIVELLKNVVEGGYRKTQDYWSRKVLNKTLASRFQCNSIFTGKYRKMFIHFFPKFSHFFEFLTRLFCHLKLHFFATARNLQILENSRKKFCKKCENIFCRILGSLFRKKISTVTSATTI